MSDLEFGKRLKERRKKAGISQVQLSDLLNLNRQATISEMERGFYDPTLSQLKMLAYHLGVSVGWLAGE